MFRNMPQLSDLRTPGLIFVPSARRVSGYLDPSPPTSNNLAFLVKRFLPLYGFFLLIFPSLCISGARDG
jgi:hypothetical protein